MHWYKILGAACYLIGFATCLQPNPPTWPSGVYIFDESDPDYAQSIIDSAFSTNGGTVPETNGQWSSYRYAFLFKQGNHSVNASLGYYTTLHGLGMVPSDVRILDVNVIDGSSDYTVGALDNFWRSAENFEISPQYKWNSLNEATMLWAVSQSCPLRRVSIKKGGLSLYQYTGGDSAGYASGGFIGDIKVDTTVYGGSQQQFCLRNIDIKNSFKNGAWNIIFIGCNFTNTSGIPNNENNECHPYTNVEKTPIVAEKPFIYLNQSSNNNNNNNDDTYSLIVPRVEWNKIGAGTNWGSNYDVIDFKYVFVVSTDSGRADGSSSNDINYNTSNIVNKMLDDGYHILFGPGIYNITSSMIIRKNNTIIGGIGFPTLECGYFTGEPCFVVADGVTGVRISGLLLQAGPQEFSTSSLLQMGGDSSLNTESNNNNNRRILKSNEKKTEKITKYKIALANYLASQYNIGHKINPNDINFGTTTESPISTTMTSNNNNNNNNNDSNSILENHSNIESTNYNFLIDVFARVGGTNNISNYQVSSKYMFEINMNNVVIDNTWLWRADHDTVGSVKNSNNPCQTGAIINGDNVIAYGLKVEHTLEDMLIWNGNNGQTYFFQSELPYDVTQENFGDLGYTAYLINENVVNHTAHGVGTYCYFRDYNVTVNSGFVVKNESQNINITHALTVHLNGNGGINHIVNNKGSAVNSTNMISYLCSFEQF